MKTSLVLCLAMLIAGSVHAEDKVPIYIVGTTPDSVGTSYLYQMREHFRASQAYVVVTTEQAAMFVVSIVTADDGATSDRGLSTAGSVTLQLENANGYNWLMTHWVITLGRNNVEAGVAWLIAAVDKAVQEFITSMAKKGGVNG